MTHQTDEELDALVGRMSKLADDMENHATYDWDEHEDVRATLNVITAIRTQLAELRAERDQLQRLANGQEEQLEIQGNMLIRLNSRCIEQSARADRAEAALADADAMIEAQAKDHAENNIRFAEMVHRVSQLEGMVMSGQGARALREAGFVRLPRHWVPREMRDEVVARAEKYLNQINHIRQEAEK